VVKNVKKQVAALLTAYKSTTTGKISTKDFF
jgi:hypothetical protein